MSFLQTNWIFFDLPSPYIHLLACLLVKPTLKIMTRAFFSHQSKSLNEHICLYFLPVSFLVPGEVQCRFLQYHECRERWKGRWRTTTWQWSLIPNRVFLPKNKKLRKRNLLLKPFYFSLCFLFSRTTVLQRENKTPICLNGSVFQSCFDGSMLGLITQRVTEKVFS